MEAKSLLISASLFLLSSCSTEEVTGDIPLLTEAQEKALVVSIRNGDGVAAERLFLFYLDVRRFENAETVAGDIAAFDFCRAVGMLSELRDTYHRTLKTESRDIVQRGAECR